MTAQPIKGFGSEAIPACYALANQELGKQCYPSMQCSQNTYKKSLQNAKAQKDKEAEGRDSSGSLT